jgi:hypothetical protein
MSYGRDARTRLLPATLLPLRTALCLSHSCAPVLPTTADAERRVRSTPPSRSALRCVYEVPRASTVSYTQGA